MTSYLANWLHTLQVHCLCFVSVHANTILYGHGNYIKERAFQYATANTNTVISITKSTETSLPPVK